MWFGPAEADAANAGVLMQTVFDDDREIGFVKADVITVTDIFPNPSSIPWYTLQTGTTLTGTTSDLIYYSRWLKIRDPDLFAGQYMKISFGFGGSNSVSGGGSTGLGGITVYVGDTKMAISTATSFHTNQNRNIQTFCIIPNSLLTQDQLITIQTSGDIVVGVGPYKSTGFDYVNVRFSTHF
jgi:hypothetical protein